MNLLEQVRQIILPRDVQGKKITMPSVLQNNIETICRKVADNIIRMAFFSSIVKVNATLLFFEDGFGRGVAFSLTKRCV